METFSADWLTLREGADHTARSAPLVAALRATLALGGTQPVTIVDLGAGTGSNLRFLAPRLGGAQRWWLVDHDATLLHTAAVSANGTALTPAQAEVRTRTADLTDVDAGFFGAAGSTQAVSLVTGSALLDLASRAWLEALAAHCARVGAAALFALTYDGRTECHPVDEADDDVRLLVNRHQHTSKGLGVAAGPDATAIAASAFRALGYQVRTAASDWRLGPADTELQRQLIVGWAEAAAAIDHAASARVNAWRERRLRLVERQVSAIRVGHQDLLALPPAPAVTR